jgi:hypothetical protein
MSQNQIVVENEISIEKEIIDRYKSLDKKCEEALKKKRSKLKLIK